MPRPFSTSQIERLGVRLARKPGPPDAADLDQLLELLSAYSVALDQATERVRAAIGFAPSARVKNTGTILEKLDRNGGSALKSMQDLGGMRVVRSQTRTEQDGLAAQILEIFADEAKAPKIIDRRTKPIQGYRAVHVVVYPDGFPIEIQVRTRIQHEWAELFEKLADILGRGIRYGQPAEHWLFNLDSEGMSDERRTAWREAVEALQAAPEHVISLAEAINVVERFEHENPSWGAEIAEWRIQLSTTLNEVRAVVDNLQRSEIDDSTEEQS